MSEIGEDFKRHAARYLAKATPETTMGVVGGYAILSFLEARGVLASTTAEKLANALSEFLNGGDDGSSGGGATGSNVVPFRPRGEGSGEAFVADDLASIGISIASYLAVRIIVAGIFSSRRPAHA